MYFISIENNPHRWYIG